MATRFKATAEGTWYKFDSPGDGIAMHSHTHPEQRHNTACIKGEVLIYGDMEDIRVPAGETVWYPSHRQHEIVAVEPDTEIVNVLLHPSNTPVDESEYCTAPLLLGRLEF